ncbi:MAG: hypothetical protein ABJC05_00490 [Pyrinomonadaceae bacterium]
MRYIVVLVLGIIVGGVLAIFLLGTPRMRTLPGKAVGPPDANGSAPGTAQIVLDDKFFDVLLGTIFNGLGPPQFKLSQMNSPSGLASITPAALPADCTNTLTLSPGDNNVKTGVRFAGGKITAPLAFTGSYNLLGNCMQFKGSANTAVQLSFDQSKQTVYGQLNIEEMNLEGVPPLANNFVTVFVQNAINERVNPFEVLRAQQLALSMPVQASGGTLKAQVKDVRAEVVEGALRLHITYDFSAVRGV